MILKIKASGETATSTSIGKEVLYDIIFNRFAANILGPEYEFDLVRGMNFIFDTSALKLDKGLAKEFSEIKNRMCRYNISVSMRRTEYRQRISIGAKGGEAFKPMMSHEMLLFTIVINSYSFTDTPNIIIPVFRDDDEQIGQIIPGGGNNYLSIANGGSNGAG